MRREFALVTTSKLHFFVFCFVLFCFCFFYACFFVMIFNLKIYKLESLVHVSDVAITRFLLQHQLCKTMPSRHYYIQIRSKMHMDVAFEKAWFYDHSIWKWKYFYPLDMMFTMKTRPKTSCSRFWWQYIYDFSLLVIWLSCSPSAEDIWIYFPYSVYIHTCLLLLILRLRQFSNWKETICLHLMNAGFETGKSQTLTCLETECPLTSRLGYQGSS